MSPSLLIVGRLIRGVPAILVLPTIPVFPAIPVLPSIPTIHGRARGSLMFLGMDLAHNSICGTTIIHVVDIY